MDTPPARKLSCSVIIPCYNEGDNIGNCIKRLPRMGEFTEAIVVDDGSADDTAAKADPGLNHDIEVKVISYKPNRGKGYAVKSGFNSAKGDVLMILDADMSVMPEELPGFFNLIQSGSADFVNGTRLLYPMERKAMPWLNYLGNRFFTAALSWITGQKITDTLCGTKAMLKKDYQKIQMEDISWGDFDLLLGAAKLGLKISEIPVHYKARVAGESKMKAFKHGWILLKICLKALWEIKLRHKS